MSTRPLEDLKVLDFSWVVAGPMVGRVLADFGATVIRVETTKKVDTARLIGPYQEGKPGVENSALFGNVNAGKYGMTLDMSTEAAREITLDLVRWADVVVESFSPGVMKKWGLDYESLCQINPKIIMLSTSLLGSTGPYSKFAGFGNLGSAMSGIMNLAGWPDEAPKGPFGPYSDYIGPRFSLVMLLAAVDHSKRTGKGCNIDMAQVEAGIHFISQGMLDYEVNHKEIDRNGNADKQMAPHGVYPCLGHTPLTASYVAISIQNDEQWQTFATIMDGKELAANQDYLTFEQRLENTEMIDKIITQWTSQLTALDVERILQSNQIPAHIVASSKDALEDPQLQHRGHFIELDHPLHHKTVVEASRYHLSDTPASVQRPAPMIGQDNEWILRNVLKYDENTISSLLTSGICK